MWVWPAPLPRPHLLLQGEAELGHQRVRQPPHLHLPPHRRTPRRQVCPRQHLNPSMVAGLPGLPLVNWDGWQDAGLLEVSSHIREYTVKHLIFVFVRRFIDNLPEGWICCQEILDLHTIYVTSQHGTCVFVFGPQFGQSCNKVLDQSIVQS